ncbi:MAG: glycosyltransferase [Chloroflexi bacterium]|nr:glycosyltransferase [Chloroflexota bacterium]
MSVVSPFPPGKQGVGEYGFHVVRHLLASGAAGRVDVLADRVGGIAGFDDGRLRIERAWTRGDPRSILALLPRLVRARPDAAWFNLGLTMFGTSGPAAATGLSLPGLAALAGLHVVVTLHELPDTSDLDSLGFHAGPVAGIAGGFAIRALLGAAWVAVTLRRYRDALVHRYGAANVVHVPLGAYAEPEMAPEPSEPRILMFASYAPHKNLPVLLDAFRWLRRERPALHLTVAGADHPRFPGYVAAVRRSAGPLSGVSWLGPVEQTGIADLFRSCTVVALPYRATTGSSSVLHYAGTYGRTAVVSCLPDFRALVEEEHLAVEFCLPNSAADLAAALARLLNDTARRRAMAAQNHAAMRALPPSGVAWTYARLFRGRPESSGIGQSASSRSRARPGL